MTKETQQEIRIQTLEESDLKWQAKTLLVLDQIDQTFASIARELMRHHSPDVIIDSFNDLWEELKRLIQSIQQGEKT